MIPGLLAIALFGLFGRPAPTASISSAKTQQVTPVIAPSMLSTPLPSQPTAGNTSPPSLGASAAFAFDASSGQIMYNKNGDTARPIASITKMMTMLAVLKDHNPDELVTIPNLPPYQAGDSLLGATAGEQFKLGDLVAASMIPSASDAADALAIYDSGTKDKFYGKMNAIAQTWGISGAQFASATGLEETGNAASPRALVSIARLGLTNQLFRSTAGTQTLTIKNTAGKSYVLKTTNELLAGGRVHGVKTGYTQAAGESFVGLATINGHDVITVVLNSPDRFGETNSLLNWITANYSWQTN